MTAALMRTALLTCPVDNSSQQNRQRTSSASSRMAARASEPLMRRRSARMEGVIILYLGTSTLSFSYVASSNSTSASTCVYSVWQGHRTAAGSHKHSNGHANELLHSYLLLLLSLAPLLLATLGRVGGRQGLCLLGLLLLGWCNRVGGRTGNACSTGAAWLIRSRSYLGCHGCAM